MFDVANYWIAKPIKKFVIKLVDGDEFQNLLVSAPNESRACELALQKTFLSSEHAVVKEVRLAEPADLGAMDVDAMTLHDYERRWYQQKAEELGLVGAQLNTGVGNRYLFLCSPAAAKKLKEAFRKPSELIAPITKEQLHSALRDCVKAMQKVRSFEGSEEEFYSALRMAEYLTLEQEVEHA